MDIAAVSKHAGAPSQSDNASWELKKLALDPNLGFIHVSSTSSTRLHVIRVTDANYTDGPSEKDALAFKEKLVRALGDYGITIKDGWARPASTSQHPQTVEKRRQFMANLYNATTGLGGLTKVRLIVVVLPNKDATIYADVK
jgi:hypothetical protein